MDVKRVVNTAFWEDDLILNDFSAEDKYFMLFLLTNRYTTQLCIYHFPIKKVAFDMGYSIESVMSLLDRFENEYHIIRFSKATNEVAIKNYLRHSILKGGKPVLDCLLRDARAVKDKSLLDYVISHLSNYEIDNNTVNTFISLVKEKENINDINNDNDNEESSAYRPRIVDESYHESSDKKTSKKEEETKHHFGEYGHVLLTDTEYNNLADRYGVEMRNKAIAFLDLYIADKGYKSKSHNYAIHRWVINAVTEQEEKANRKSSGSAYIDAIANRVTNVDSFVDQAPTGLHF